MVNKKHPLHHPGLLCHKIDLPRLFPANRSRFPASGMSDSLEEKFGAWELFEQLWEKETQLDYESILRDAPYHDRLKLSRDTKNSAKAQSLRTKGNQLLKVKRYVAALKCYNESIAFSEKGSEERAIAYANRSFICYELHRYEECLQNVRLARESNYPEHLASKLVKREEDAKKALQDGANKGCEKSTNGASSDTTDDSKLCDSELKLSYDAYETVPQVAQCLELSESDQFGRYVATNRNLQAGDVVIIEQPFSRLLLDVYRHVRCDFCHRESIFTLLPCESCTVAMYCSGSCASQAARQYHRYECPIIRDMWRIFTKLPVMSLRTVTTAISAFEYDLPAMWEHLQALDKAKVNAFTMDWTSASAKDIYDTVHVLETNERTRDRKDRMVRVFYTTIIYRLLEERCPELGELCGMNDNVRELLNELILRHLQTGPVNMHSLHYMEYQPEQRVYEMENHVSACFPILSMLNHSCASNVTRITLRDGRCAVLVTRPIAKGGQLYDNYGMHHCLMSRKERKTELLKQYRFICECEACVNNYPLYFELPAIDSSRYGMIDTQSLHAELVLHQKDKAAELLPKLRRYLNDIGDQYPRSETCSCQELFLRAFQILYMPTSESAEYFKYCNP
ncbi:SET and MYND domain-containing protein 4 isoform X1 [Anopheles merus]|nr:SET and MYND domain-containing protein 4 isoform X1 [Anopheles merus]